ncbi:MAG: flagellar motor switch phosphatase FliY [Epulopiscium sp.]|jgi:flagellar motor switch protein FliN/FliY|nr:flagellar motor switch phosphatase FliY [Candidatus Epulonipiscium sp.]
MGDMLSQAEIDALLGGTDIDDDISIDNFTEDASNIVINDPLTDDEKDALGEIGNISMGTAATTLFTLLNQKVIITTPDVKVMSWEQLANEYGESMVAINVEYKEGLEGINLLILKENDVKIIADLMMGGAGQNTDEELTELHLSAISEAMNQMVGSASTSMSSIFNKKIDIKPPHAFIPQLDKGKVMDNVGFGDEGIVRVCFKMKIGELIDSEIMQILPLDFAKTLAANLIKSQKSLSEAEPEPTKVVETPPQAPQPTQQVITEPPKQEHIQVNQTYYESPTATQPSTISQPHINVQSAQFQTFDQSAVIQTRENIEIIKDVPLEVTVELGRTHKLIRDILEFSPGTVIELDKLAGEPVDVLVNGKFVAKGEVVVIDENFGIRITDIVNPEKRI